MTNITSRSLTFFAAFITALVSVSAFTSTPASTKKPSISKWSHVKPAFTKNQNAVLSHRADPLYASSLADLAQDYQYLVSSYPLVTQSATFGMFSGIGDLAAQSTANNNEQSNKNDLYDANRSLRFIIKGLGSGLIWAAWYNMADGWASLLTQQALSTLDAVGGGSDEAIVRTVICILLEQFIACPIVYSLWDIPVPSLLRGDPPSSIPETVKQKVPSLLVDNAKVWTFANVLIYNIPLEWRVFALSCAEIFWASIVSSVASKTISKLQ